MTDTQVAAPAGNWFDGLAPEDMSYITNRGLEKGDARTAFVNAMTAHKQAEQLIGVPPNELLRLPKDLNDAAGWLKVHERLGVPKEAKDYDLSSVKMPDGKDIDASFADALKASLLSANVSKDKAAVIAKSLVDVAAKADTSASDAKLAALNTEREALKIDWGPNSIPNLTICKNTVKTLGLDETVISTLENSVGYAKTMQAILKIGRAMGEDKFVQGGGNGDTPMDGTSAKEMLDTKMGDTAWVARFNAGDATALKEFDTLTRLQQKQR